MHVFALFLFVCLFAPGNVEAYNLGPVRRGKASVSLPFASSSRAKATTRTGKTSHSPPPILSSSSPVSTLLPRNPNPLLFTVLASLAIAISYADRTNLSTSIIPMTNQYGWDASTSGLILSSFWLGYGSSQVVGGRLADKYSGEWLLLIAIVAWSICTGLVPAGADAGVGVLAALRVLLGLAEGLALPAVHSMISSYIPAKEQSTVASVITASCYIGALLSNLVTPILIERNGWESSFYVFAVLPIIWVPLWLCYILSNSSEGVTSLQRKDEAYEAADEVSIKQLLSQRPVWAIMLAQYGQGVGNIGLLSWLPTYYSENFHVPLSNLAKFTVLPYFLQMGMAIGAGYLADYMIVNYVCIGKLTVRNFFQLGGSFLPALFLLLCVYGVPGGIIGAEYSKDMSAESAEKLITLGSACTALTVASVSCNHFDISPKNSGTIFGLGNTVSCIGGLLAVSTTGYIYDETHSWDLIFALFAFHYVFFGGILWLFLASADNIENGPLSFDGVKNNDNSQNPLNL